MSSNLQNIEAPDRIFSVPDLLPRRTINGTDHSALGTYGLVVQKLIQTRQERGGCVVTTFTSVTSGEGVTSVIDSLSRELARYAGEPVLVTSPAGLAGAHLPFRITEPLDPRKIWRLGPSMTGRWHRHPDEARDALRTVQERFAFILLDCPSLRSSSAIFPAASISDGIVLVVAAGETKRREVEEARRLLAATSVPLLGIVLNKHTSYVPKFLSGIL